MPDKKGWGQYQYRGDEDPTADFDFPDVGEIPPELLKQMASHAFESSDNQQTFTMRAIDTAAPPDSEEEFVKTALGALHAMAGAWLIGRLSAICKERGSTPDMASLSVILEVR